MKKENDAECNCGWCKNVAPLYNSIYEKLSGDVMSLTNGDLESIRRTLLKIEQLHSVDYTGVENAMILLSKKFEAGNN